MQRVCALNNYISKYREYFLISFLVFVAFALRLYRITEQSIWHEEYVYIANIKICDLWTNIKLLFINVPEYGLSPAGLVLYFFWVRIFPNTIWIWRLLPICFGILSIILLYFLGKWVKDWKVGFLAGMLMALSPFNIYIHQELKGYAFILFFSLLSWFAFLNYLNNCKSKKWLFIGALSNLLLPWFHAMYFAIPFIQFPLLIWYKRRYEIKYILLWVIINGSVLIPYILWILWIKPPVYNPTLTKMESLNVEFIMTSLWGIDCIGFSNELLPYWKTNIIEIIKSPLWKYLLSKWEIIDYFLIVMVISLFVVYCSYLVIERLRFNKDSNEIRKYLLFYLFVFSFLPFLVLRIITEKSFFLPLYFYHSFAFLYLIIAYSIFIRDRYVINISLIIMIIILFTLQCLGFVKFNLRPDYKNAVAYIEENVKKEDIVLDLQLGANVFDTWKIYKTREDYSLNPVFSLQSIAETTIKTLSSEEKKINNSIWVLMETTLISWIYKEDPTFILVRKLTPMGFNVNIKHFPGKFNLYVLKIEKDSYKKIKEEDIQICPFGKIDYDNIMDELQIKTADNIENQRIKEILQRYFSIWHPFYSYNYILIINSMIQNGDIDVAEKICDYLINKSPEFYHVIFLKAIILFSKQKKNESQKLVEGIFKNNYFFKDMYKTLWDDENISGIREKNISLIKELEQKGYHILNKPILNVLLKNS